MRPPKYIVAPSPEYMALVARGASVRAYCQALSELTGVSYEEADAFLLGMNPNLIACVDSPQGWALLAGAMTASPATLLAVVH